MISSFNSWNLVLRNTGDQQVYRAFIGLGSNKTDWNELASIKGDGAVTHARAV